MKQFSKTFTEEEKREICKNYRIAKNPKEQIGILADLNACSKSSIEAVLEEAGLIGSSASPPPSLAA